MLDIVQSGANNNNCIYPLDPGRNVVCANCLTQGVLILFATCSQFCPPNASLVNCAALLALAYIWPIVSPGWMTKVFGTPFNLGESNTCKNVCSLAAVNTLSHVILSNHLNTFSACPPEEIPKWFFKKVSIPLKL